MPQSVNSCTKGVCHQTEEQMAEILVKRQPIRTPVCVPEIIARDLENFHIIQKSTTSMK